MKTESRKKIMLIDDDRTFIALIQGVLRKNNYDVVVASNGQEGIDCVRQECPDLIILDVLMPGMTGYEFIQKIRKLDPEYKKIPVIVISAKKSMKDFFNMWELSFFIEKPFQPQELLSKIEYALTSNAVNKSHAEAASAPVGKGRKALIVGYDNNEMMQIEKVLKEQGFRIARAKREIEGMMEALTFGPDVIITQYHNVKGVINVERFKEELNSKDVTRVIPMVVAASYELEKYCLADFNKEQVVSYRNHPELERKLARALDDVFKRKQ